MKCKCSRCGKEQSYPTEVDAWKDGWDILSDDVMLCDNCPAAPDMMDILKKP